MLVGGDGAAYVSGGPVTWVIGANDDYRWDAVGGAFHTSFLRPGTFDTTIAEPGSRATEAQTTGDILSSSPWPRWGARVAMDEDGSAFVELIDHHSIQAAFEGVARARPDGTTQWIEKGDCDPGGNDFPAPHDFVRRDDHLILVCNTHDSAVEVLEVDSNDAQVWQTFVDGGLVGNIGLAPNGDLEFFVSFGGSSASLISVSRDHGTTELGGVGLPNASIEAVAADGALLVRTTDGVAAVSNGSLRWKAQLAGAHATFVDSDHTVITASSDAIVALDVASGSTIWQVTLPNENVLSLASAGAGKVYALSETNLTLLSD